MQIAKIINDSPAEVEGHFADVIFFQECHRKCPYCFNPELIPKEGGKEMTVSEVILSLSNLSKVVVLTGGEPTLQSELPYLIKLLKELNKKVILETSIISEYICKSVDKVYLSLKTFNHYKYNEKIRWDIWLKVINSFSNMELVLVIGHPWFELDALRDIIDNTDKQIWLKFYNGKMCDTKEIYRIFKNRHKKYKMMDKLQL